MNRILIALIGAFVLNNAYADEIIISSQQQLNLGITVSQLGKNTALSSRHYPAEIVVPIGQERVMSAPQSGLLDMLYVAAGQEVKKGQPVAHLTSPDLVGFQRDYLQALTQKKLADQTLARDQELFKDGIIAQRRYLETQSKFEEASASLAQRKQALRLSGMSDGAINQLQSSSGMSGGITLTAPMDGQVLEQMVTVGQRVDMAMPLYRIGHLNPLWLEIHAPLEGLPFVKLGMPVNVPKLQASGKLIAIVRSVNKTDQTLHLRAEINQGAEKLSPGQFVEAEINLGGTNSHFSVPKSALVRKGPEAWLFVQSVKGFTPVKISVISEQGDEAIIDGNFKGQEKIAVTGTTALKGSWIGLRAE